MTVNLNLNNVTSYQVKLLNLLQKLSIPGATSTMIYIMLTSAERPGSLANEL